MGRAVYLAHYLEEGGGGGMMGFGKKIEVFLAILGKTLAPAVSLSLMENVYQAQHHPPRHSHCVWSFVFGAREF